MEGKRCILDSIALIFSNKPVAYRIPLANKNLWSDVPKHGIVNHIPKQPKRERVNWSCADFILRDVKGSKVQDFTGLIDAQFQRKVNPYAFKLGWIRFMAPYMLTSLDVSEVQKKTPGIWW